MFRALLASCLLLVGAAHANAQQPNEATRPAHLTAGGTIWVTMHDGSVIRGIVKRGNATSIDVVRAGIGATLKFSDIRRIEKPDSIVDGIGKGALIGASAGVPWVIFGLMACDADSYCEGYPFLFGLTWAGLGAGIGAVVGAVVDRTHEHRRTVWESRSRRIAISPVLARRGGGVGAVIRW